MKSESEIVKQIVKRYGAVLDLKENPGVIIDILRRFGNIFIDEDGGLPPGGTPPPPPPGPSSFQGQVSNEELMRQLLKLSKDVAKLRKELTAK